MINPLAAETTFEARAKAGRATVMLLALLFVIYAFFSLALAGVLVLFVFLHAPALYSAASLRAWFPAFYIAGALALLSAAIHYFLAWRKPLEGLLAALRAIPADPQDHYHAAFLGVLSELEAACAVRPILGVVVSSPGMNAFALQDGRGRSAIGVTEGMLTNLDRSELSAVLCHEASHLAQHDSRLSTLLCSLMGSFEAMRLALQPSLRLNRGSRRGSGDGVAVALAAWMVASVADLVTRFVCMAISREREYLADSQAVRMCQDPRALAGALLKISRRYAGGGELPQAYSPLYFAPSHEGALDGGEGWAATLFSTHPPMARRIERLLAWAKEDLATLQKEAAAREPVPQAAGQPEEKLFYINKEGAWTGPLSVPQIQAFGVLLPGDWICPFDSKEVQQAGEHPDLAAVFAAAHPGGAPQRCPRCKLPLLEREVEGAETLYCSFCRGSLLKQGVFERLLSRRMVRYSEEEVKKAVAWRDAQKGSLKQRSAAIGTRCPYCAGEMDKAIYSIFTQVVLHRCANDSCRAVWCEGGVLDTAQALVQDAGAS